MEEIITKDSNRGTMEEIITKDSNRATIVEIITKEISRATMEEIIVDTVDTVEGVCNGFLPYTWFLGFPEFSGYHQWQQESQ